MFLKWKICTDVPVPPVVLLLCCSQIIGSEMCFKSCNDSCPVCRASTPPLFSSYAKMAFWRSKVRTIAYHKSIWSKCHFGFTINIPNYPPGLPISHDQCFPQCWAAVATPSEAWWLCPQSLIYGCQLWTWVREWVPPHLAQHLITAWL